MSGFAFLSYSHANDGPYANQLAKYLEAQGLRVWFDVELVTGDRWEALIREQIDACSAFVVIMTPSAEASPWVAREISRAERSRKPIFPVLLEGEEFFQLSELQYEDVSDGRMPGPRFVARLRVLIQNSPGDQVERSAPPPRAAPTMIDATPLRNFQSGGPYVDWSKNGGLATTFSREPRGYDVSVVGALNGEILSEVASVDAGYSEGIVVSPDSGRIAVSVGGSVRIWTVPDKIRIDPPQRAREPFRRREMPRPREPQVIVNGDGHYSARSSWTPDGRYLAVGRSSEVHIVDTESGLVVQTLIGHLGFVSDVEWSTTSAGPVSSSHDGTVWIWDRGTGTNLRVLSGHDAALLSLSCSPDGRHIATASADRTCRIWDLMTGICLRTLTGHADAVSSVQYSPDGVHLASGGHDKTVRLWDAGSGRIMRTLTGHSANLRSVRWSPDGRYLASADDSRTVMIWGVSRPDM